MSSLTKKVLIIIALVLLLGILASIPGFAETQEELRQIFVTRDEVNAWINGSGSSTGISQALASLEKNVEEQVYSRVKVEMKKREIKDPNETTTESP